MSTTPQQVNIWNQPHYQAGLNIDNGQLIVSGTATFGAGTHNYGSIDAAGTSSFGYANDRSATYSTYLGANQVGLELRGNGSSASAGPAMVFHWENTNTLYLWNNKTGQLELNGDHGATLNVQNDVMAGGNLNTSGGHLVTNMNSLTFDRVAGGKFAWHIDSNGPSDAVEVANLDDNGNLSISGTFYGNGEGLTNVPLLDSEQLVARKYIPVNGLVYGPEINGIVHFDGDTITTTRGTNGTFSRASTANDPTYLGVVQANDPRYVNGELGKGIYIEEATTNLVYNTEAATVTSTSTLMIHNLTDGTGWTTLSGTFNFSASGALASGAYSEMYIGNNIWAPLNGSNGQVLPITFQSNFTMPSSIAGNGYSVQVALYQDTNHRYGLRYNPASTNVELFSSIDGTTTVLASGSFTEVASTTYTFIIELDNVGNLSGKVMNGANNSITPLSVSNTSITGGFSALIGVDTSVTATAAKVTGPFADAWWINQNGVNYGIALIEAQLDGKNAIAVNDYSDGSWFVLESNNFSVASGSQYTMSFWAKADEAATVSASISESSGLNRFGNTNIGLTTEWQQFIITGTAPNDIADETVYITFDIHDVWTYFTAFQVENKPYATTYVQNNSTTSSFTRDAESLTYPTSKVIGDNAPWSISMWAKTNVDASTFRMPFSAWQNFYVSLNPSNHVQFSWVDSNNNQHSVSSADIVSNPTGWHHWAMTFDGTNAIVYLDAQPFINVSITSQKALPTQLSIGSLSASEYYWNGVIDEVVFFNEVISATTVYEIYTNPSPIVDAFQTSVTQVSGNSISMTPTPDAIVQYDPNGDITVNTLYVENNIQMQGAGPTNFSGSVTVGGLYIASGTMFDNTGKSASPESAIGSYEDGVMVKSNAKLGSDSKDVFTVVTNDEQHLLDIKNNSSTVLNTNLTISGHNMYFNTEDDVTHSMFWDNTASSDTLTIQYGQRFLIQTDQSSIMVPALSLDEYGNMEIGGSFTTFSSLNVSNMSDRNLFKNGSFETGDFTDWIISQPSGTTVTGSVVSGIDAPHGNKYAKLVVSGDLATNIGAGLAYNFTYDANTEYTLTAWIYAPKGVSIAFNSPRAQANNLIETLYNPNGTDGWVRYVWNIYALSTSWTEDITLSFWTGNANQSAETIYVDAVQIEQGLNWSEYSEQYGQMYGDQSVNKGNLTVDSGNIELTAPNYLSLNGATGDNAYRIWASSDQMYFLGDGGFVFQHDNANPTTAMSMDSNGIVTIGDNTKTTSPSLIIEGPVENKNQWGNIYLGGGSSQNYDLAYDGGSDGTFDFGNVSTVSGAVTKFYGTNTSGGQVEILDLHSTGDAEFKGALQVDGITTLEDMVYANRVPSGTSDNGAIMVGTTHTVASGTVNGVIGFPGYGVGHAQIAWVPGNGIYLMNSSGASPNGAYPLTTGRVPLYTGKLYSTFNTLDDGSGNVFASGSFVINGGNGFYYNGVLDNNHRIFETSKDSNVAEWWEFGQVNIRTGNGSSVTSSTPAVNINNGNLTVPNDLKVDGTATVSNLALLNNFTLNAANTATSSNTSYPSRGIYLLGSKWNGSAAVDNGYVIQADGNGGLNFNYDNANTVTTGFNFNSGTINVNGSQWYTDSTNMAVRIPKASDGRFYVQYTDGSYAPLNAAGANFIGTIDVTSSSKALVISAQGTANANNNYSSSTIHFLSSNWYGGNATTNDTYMQTDNNGGLYIETLGSGTTANTLLTLDNTGTLTAYNNLSVLGTGTSEFYGDINLYNGGQIAFQSTYNRNSDSAWIDFGNSGLTTEGGGTEASRLQIGIANDGDSSAGPDYIEILNSAGTVPGHITLKTALNGSAGVQQDSAANGFVDIQAGSLRIQGKPAIINTGDNWLRINDGTIGTGNGTSMTDLNTNAGSDGYNGLFTEGVYFGDSVVRTDGQLQVGPNGSDFYVKRNSGVFMDSGLPLTLGIVNPPSSITLASGTGTVGSNLAANTTYTYTVSVITENEIETTVTNSGGGASNAASITLGSTAVPISISWTKLNYAASYNIYKDGKFLANTSNTSYTDNGNTATTSQVPPTINTTGQLTTGYTLLANHNYSSTGPTVAIGDNGYGLSSSSAEMYLWSDSEFIFMSAKEEVGIIGDGSFRLYNSGTEELRFEYLSSNNWNVNAGGPIGHIWSNEPILLDAPNYGAVTTIGDLNVGVTSGGTGDLYVKGTTHTTNLIVNGFTVGVNPISSISSTDTPSNWVSGFYAYGVYNDSSYPNSYGDVISVNGTNGQSSVQLFIPWDDGSSAAGAPTGMFVRANRDVNNEFGSWQQVAVLDQSNNLSLPSDLSVSNSTQLNDLVASGTVTLNNLLVSGTNTSFTNNMSIGGALELNTPLESMAATSGGTVYWVQDMQGTVKRVIIYLSNYTNNTGTAQVINFPTAFSQFNATTFDSTNGAVNGYTLSSLTLETGSAGYSGMIIVEGV